MAFLRKRDITDEERRRLPPGQHLVRDFPVLHAGSIPYRGAPAGWDFRIWGGVVNEGRWSLDEFRALPTVAVTTDIHCVTKWSKLDTAWEGYSVDVLLHGVIEHGTYHGGQIMMLRKALG